MTQKLTHMFKNVQFNPAKFLLLIILISANCASNTLAANNSINPQEKWYEVEVIFFANKLKGSKLKESWPTDVGNPDTSKTIDVLTPTEELFEDNAANSMYYVEPVELRENSLDKIAFKIKRSKKYQLLTHRTWRQTLKKKSRSTGLFLTDNDKKQLFQTLRDPNEIEEDIDPEIGDISAEALLLEALLAEEKISSSEPEPPFFIHELDPIELIDDVQGLPVDNNIIELTPMGPPNHKLYGTFKLYKNRYLHVSLDFLYRTLDTGEAETEIDMEKVFPMANNEDLQQTIVSSVIPAFPDQEKPPLTGIRLKKSKRIRLKEVHYFDHPLFGAIVKVSPYEPPPEEDTSKNGNS